MKEKKRLLQASIAVTLGCLLLLPSTIGIGAQLSNMIQPSIAITYPTAGASVNTTAITVTGEATDDTGVVSVEIFLDGVSEGNTVLNPGPSPIQTTLVTWSKTLTLLAEGKHTVLAVARDSDNNARSTTVDFAVDLFPPVITVPSPITVHATTPEGVLKTHTAISAFLAGAVAYDTIDPSPTVTNNAPTRFPLGTTTVTFVATDDAGNSASALSSVTVMNADIPLVTITQPPNGSKLNTTTITVSGTVSPIVATVEILADNVSQGNALLHNTLWTKALTLTEGSHVITARAISLANTGANNIISASVNIIIDTTPPLITITAPADNATLTSTVSIKGTAVDANGIASVVVSVDNGPASSAVLVSGTAQWSFQTTISPGHHTIKTIVTDSAGNRAMASISVNVLGNVSDTVLPTIEITSLSMIANANRFNVTIGGTSSDNDKVLSVQVKIDNNTFENAVGTTSWSFATTLAEGLHTVTAKATDKAGNVSTKTISMRLGVIVPNRPEPSPIQVQNTYTCNGQKLSGKLELQGVNASFTNCEIRGNIKLENSAVIFRNSVIKGGIKLQGSNVTLESSEVRGTLHVEGGSITLNGSKIGKNLNVEDSFLTLESNEIKGNLQIEGGSLLIKNNAIQRHVKICDVEILSADINIVKGHTQGCQDDEDDDNEHENEDGNEHNGSNSAHSGQGNSNHSHKK